MCACACAARWRQVVVVVVELEMAANGRKLERHYLDTTSLWRIEGVPHTRL